MTVVESLTEGEETVRQSLTPASEPLPLLGVTVLSNAGKLQIQPIGPISVVSMVNMLSRAIDALTSIEN